MKLTRTLTIASVGIGTIAAMALAQGGCSGSTTVTTEDGGHDSGTGTGKGTGTGTGKGTGTGTGTGKGSSGTGSSTGTGTGVAVDGGNIQPPDASGDASTFTTAHNFAIHYLYLGDQAPPNPVPGVTAPWQNFGYNIDGLDTTAFSTDVCERQNGAPSSEQVDGPGGIDNSFGANIDSLISGLGESSSSISTADVQQGKFTILLDTVGLDSANPTTQTATGLSAQVFAGANYGSAPPTNAAGTGFAITDNWPVSAALLNGTTVASGSKVSFPAAYITKGTWVNGSAATIPLSLSLAGQAITINITHARITFNYTVDATMQGHATGGIISGVINTADFINTLNTIGPSLPGGCSTLQSVGVFGIIDAAQDILSDGTNKGGVPCDAISIGLGFESDEIAVPSVVAPTTDAGTVVPCGSDAGAGSGSGTGQ